MRQRPYHVESTRSRQLPEVKLRRVPLVLGWVTAWEYGMLLAFSFFAILNAESESSTGKTVGGGFVTNSCSCAILKTNIYCNCNMCSCAILKTNIYSCLPDLAEMIATIRNFLAVIV